MQDEQMNKQVNMQDEQTNTSSSKHRRAKPTVLLQTQTEIGIKFNLKGLLSYLNRYAALFFHSYSLIPANFTHASQQALLIMKF